MLLSEEFSRDHESRLATVLHGRQHGQQGDNGLAAADVALEKTKHACVIRKILVDFDQSASLSARQSKRERIDYSAS